MDNFIEGQRVKICWDPLFTTGTIRGISSTDMPVLGRIWIVELDEKPSPESYYEYSCVSIPEVGLSPEEKE